MKKVGRIAVALLICLLIFVLWQFANAYIGRGILVGLFFCTIMYETWKAIVNSDDEADDIIKNTGEDIPEEVEDGNKE